MNGLLSFVIFFPVVIGIFIGILGSKSFFKNRIKLIAIIASIVEMFASVLIFLNYDKNIGGIQFIDYFDSWIPFSSFTARYLIGVDGLSTPLSYLPEY